MELTAAHPGSSPRALERYRLSANIRCAGGSGRAQALPQTSVGLEQFLSFSLALLDTAETGQ